MKLIKPFNIVEFEVTDEIYEEYKNFISNKPNAYYGMIGGRFSLEITPTSMGNIYVLKDDLEKTKLNLTDFDCW